MFNSRFSDSDNNEIDLTSAVKNVEDLEQVVNFIYTCKIEITRENLWGLVQLASFFLMESLCGKLRECMMRKLSRDTCLQYYSCAKAAGISDVEGMASVMLKAWFHDYLIDMDETLDITPNDLKDFEEKGFLKMCEITQILDFIANWVGRHHTEKHITVASHVLTAFMKISFSSSPKNYLKKKQVKKSFTRMLTILKKSGLDPTANKEVANFVNIFQNALDGEARGNEEESSLSVSRSTSTRKRRRESSDKNQNEIVLVALGNLRSEDNDSDDGGDNVDDDNSDDGGDNVDDDDSDDVDDNVVVDDSDDVDDNVVVDDDEYDVGGSDDDYFDEDMGLDWYNGKPIHICIYVPSSRCWLRYCTVPVHNIALTNDFYEELKIVDFFMFRDYIFTYSYKGHSLFFYQHKGKSSSPITKRTVKESSRHGSLLDSFFTVHNDVLYMVNRCLQYESRTESSLDEGERQKVQLIGYRLDENLKFVKLFTTEPVQVTGGFEYDKDCGPVRDTQIRISSKTNEMLIVHSTFDSISPASTVIFLVKLGANSCPVKVLLNTNSRKKLMRECHIVEMDDRFLIVCKNDNTQVLCEYVFLSEKISFNTGYTPGEVLYDSSKTNVSPDATTVNGTHCLWHFEVYLQKLCILKSADFSKKQMTVTEHRSAPFSRIFSVHETRLPEAFLKTLQKL